MTKGRSKKSGAGKKKKQKKSDVASGSNSNRDTDMIISEALSLLEEKHQPEDALKLLESVDYKGHRKYWMLQVESLVHLNLHDKAFESALQLEEQRKSIDRPLVLGCLG
ncbi:single-stranded-DNA-specific exonuclease RecJ [Striga asiatica]|uniref:Single-stranded-DNA-specific exonuclease RecJ n=1 Tax=Striga asiatica TaxID=4170 RepID=A0A5A7QA17_STRAF|nr:single-stranded-DNA-specific exonuclease RecJ [Striga asiatica]GER42404.1 single-stranded-DNA-specific exonuclease RecJ [Striga asiatica]